MNYSTLKSTSKGFALVTALLFGALHGFAAAIPMNRHSSALEKVRPDNLIPTISVPNGPYICNGGSVTLTSSAADTYQWYKNNILIDGATSQTYSASSIGTYKVSVSYGEGSTGTSAGMAVKQAVVWTGAATDDEWNNPANWSCGTIPTATDMIVINQTVGTYPVISGESLASAYSLLLNDSARLEVEGGSTLQVTDVISVHANALLNLQNEASLVQVNDVNNIGNISVQRTTTPMKRYDFTYWSSPVSNQTLYNLSPNTLSDKYFSFSPVIGNWVTHLNGTQVMEEGKGYIVRGPQSYSATAAVPYEAQFVGTPNNGDVAVPILIGNSDVNLIGNPYPSAVDLNAFIMNPVNAALTEGTVYLWTHNSSPVGNEGNTSYDYTSNDYAAYNLLGGTATLTTGNNETPNGKLASGQSFMIKAIGTGSAIFNNSMRIAFNNDQFFRSNTSLEKHRLWLNFSNSQGAFKQTLIGYADGATDGIDRNFDGITFNGNSFVDFYSISDAKNFTIQGRALPFDQNTILPLGYSTTIGGTFTVGLAAFDGLFETQDVYLYDYVTQTTHDLKSGSYEFTSTMGTFNNRFELHFTNGLLGTASFSSSDAVVIAAQKGQFDIRSAQTIRSLTVLDMNGRKLYEDKAVNTKEKTFPLNVNNAVLLVKVQLDNGTVHTKKVMMN